MALIKQTSNHLVPFSNQILDGDVSIWKSGKELPDMFDGLIDLVTAKVCTSFFKIMPVPNLLIVRGV